MSDVAVELDGIWKIFGEDETAVIDTIRKEGLDKAEVLERFDAVVGIADVSFRVERGEIFCVMGLSGCGKSTLVRHINRLIEPSAGSIRLFGKDVLAMIVLSRLGFDIGPIFAGAGVVGIAVGFGAQTLIRDIFSGAFFLLDDAFRNGEYVEIDGIKGTVERISVRSFQLRHHLGALHTIPFGEIKRLTNFSRDWVLMKLPLRVTYDTDVDKVRKLVKKLGQELLNHPQIGHTFMTDEGSTRYTASFGLTDAGDDTADAQAFLKAADKLLYQAKGEGRNRVVTRSRNPSSNPGGSLPNQNAASAICEPEEVASYTAT